MSWRPFDLFRKDYDFFGEDILDDQFDRSVNHSSNTARSLFIDKSVENDFRSIQNSNLSKFFTGADK